MLNDRDRHLLNDLERQLEHEDPAWVRQFKDPKPPRRTRRDLRLGTAMGLLVLLTALCLLLDIPVAAVIFGSTVIVLAYVHYRR
jgi:4-hydroxybenzoate polyprenyltransferase